MSDENLTEPGDTARAERTPAPESPTGADNATLQRERDDLYDRLLRKSAEFDNYRKRIDKERREQAEWAAADVLGDVIAVLDDFERALSAEAPPEARSYVAGFELIHRQLGDLLRKRGVTTIEALGSDLGRLWWRSTCGRITGSGCLVRRCRTG